MKPTKDKYPGTETESLTFFTSVPRCWHIALPLAYKQ